MQRMLRQMVPASSLRRVLAALALFAVAWGGLVLIAVLAAL